MEQMLSKAKELGWNIALEDATIYELRKTSPKGLDFRFLVDSEGYANGFVENLHASHSNFDPLEELPYWLEEVHSSESNHLWTREELIEELETHHDDIWELFNALLLELTT